MSVEHSTRLWRIGTAIVVALSIALVGGGGIYLAVTNADLRTQLTASQSNAQELYEQLLDEGVEPEGEEPDQVSPAAPANGRDGKDGKDGDRGPQGPGATSAQVLEGIQTCFAAGTCTAPKGDPGAMGVPGAASTVPGPVGPAGPEGPVGPAGPGGPAGPICPEGFTPTLVWLSASESETDIPTPKQAIVCLPTPTTGEAP